MVGTKHCAWGTCTSDSRHQESDDLKDVFFIPFVKPHIDLDKCKRWINACHRELFTVEKVKKWTYICSKHFVGGYGPTPENPDPLRATMTDKQVSNLDTSVSLAADSIFEIRIHIFQRPM
jgi:hypothetical protein